MVRDLWLYDRLSRRGPGGYRAKLVLVAVVAAQLPLLVLSGALALTTAWAWPAFVVGVVLTLAAILAGAGLALVGLHHLLRPVLLAAEALRSPLRGPGGMALPTAYHDEAGALMADVAGALDRLRDANDGVRFLDVATGLPNRQALVRDLDRVPRTYAAACVLRFASYPRVVEALDRAAAETAATTLATRLLTGPAAPARLYRVSGSDFVLLLDESHARDPQRCEETLAGCIEAASALLPAGDVMVDPAFLAGVAVWPADARTPDTLIDNAAAAVPAYRKEERIGFHSPSARAASGERRRCEHDLRLALERDEFVLHYQPVIDLARARVVGAEALIRWQHPERGLVPPGDFIEVAERSELIDRIGLWVIGQACHQGRLWNEAGLERLTISVNLSARQFGDPNLIRHVDEALQASGISPDQLEVELTEATATADEKHARAVFGRLRDRGIGIAIDDFGIGSSALSLLLKLPFNTLKIDRAFVADVHAARESQAVCNALVTLSRGIGLRVLAEGIEQADEARYLYEAGCDLYQGAFFCRPLGADAMARAIPGLSLASASLALGVPRRAPDRVRLAS